MTHPSRKLPSLHLRRVEDVDGEAIAAEAVDRVLDEGDVARAVLQDRVHG